MNKQTENTLEEIENRNREGRFAEWCSENLWHYEEIEPKKWVKIDWENECDIYKTTSELLDQFNKENK